MRHFLPRWRFPNAVAASMNARSFGCVCVRREIQEQSRRDGQERREHGLELARRDFARRSTTTSARRM
jgi:hypothetical protein